MPPHPLLVLQRICRSTLVASTRGTLETPVALPGVITAGLSVAVVAAEQARQVLGIAEAILNNRRGVGVVQDVVAEPAVVAQDVVDQGAQKGDVAAGADADINVAECRCARETRIDVDQGRAAFL